MMEHPSDHIAFLKYYTTSLKRFPDRQPQSQKYHIRLLRLVKEMGNVPVIWEPVGSNKVATFLVSVNNFLMQQEAWQC
jgi:hypothetical protein